MIAVCTFTGCDRSVHIYRLLSLCAHSHNSVLMMNTTLQNINVAANQLWVLEEDTLFTE